MVLPIVAYGDKVLREKCEDVDFSKEELDALLEDMYETMYAAEGVGLAAPQVGKNIRVFIVDAEPFEDEEPELKGFKKAFINPKIVEETGDEWSFKEGCLSIPGIRENVTRNSDIKIKYLNEDLKEEEAVFSGLAARVIQHEYDHIEGVLFIDKISPMKKRLIKGKLNDIAKGKVRINYRMRFPK